MIGRGIARAAHTPSARPRAEHERRVVATLVGAAFVSSTGGLAFGPLLPLIAADLGVGVAALGQLPALAALAAAALALGIGPLADRHGHGRALALALLGLAVALLGVGLAPGYAFLAVALLLAAPGQAAVSPTAQAIAGARFAGGARRRAIGWITAASPAPPSSACRC